jgi:hypothetical protein
MRKSFSIIIILLAGIILMGYVFREELYSFVSPENSFRIADTAAISRIELISHDSIILVREENNWILNSGTTVSSVSVNNFLFSFSRMKAKGSRNNAGLENEKYVKLIVLEGRKSHRFRYYQVNGVSYLQKEGNKKLFLIEVDGFPNIKPAEILSSDKDHWADRVMLNLKAGEIQEITVSHTSDAQKDFQIKIQDGIPVLFDGNRQNPIPVDIVDREKLSFYLSYFTNVFYDETYADEDLPDFHPLWILKVKDKKGKEYELQIFPLKTSVGEDLFKGLVKYNNLPGYKITRYMVLDLLLQEKQHFLLK